MKSNRYRLMCTQLALGLFCLGCDRKAPAEAGPPVSSPPGLAASGATAGSSAKSSPAAGNPTAYSGPLNFDAAQTSGQLMSPSQWLKVYEQTADVTQREDLVRMCAAYAPEAAPGLFRKAASSETDSIRLAAVLAAAEMEGALPVRDVVVTALSDSSKDVRDNAFEHIRKLPPSDMMDVLKPLLASMPHDELALASIQEIAATHSRTGVELLLDTAGEMQTLRQAAVAENLGLVFQRDFPDIQAARSWWAAAKEKLDEGLVLVDPADALPR